MHFFFFIFSVLSAPNFLLAQEVDWYQPTIAYSAKRNETRVVLGGKTTPNAKVMVLGDTLMTLDKVTREADELSFKEALPEGHEFHADDKGHFSITMVLPSRLVQVPISITETTGEMRTKSFQLNFMVTEDSVSFLDRESLQTTADFKWRYQLWFGAGQNYLIFEQKSSEIEADLKFTSTEGPSFFLEGLVWVNENTEINMTAKHSPGHVNDDEVVIDGKDYLWATYAIESTFYPKSWSFVFKKLARMESGVRWGVQSHTMPFLERDASSSADLSLNELQFTALSLGYKLVASPSHRWSFELQARYQYPLLFSGSATAEAGTHLDWSLGAIMNDIKKFHIGLFWYCQYHDFSYKTDDELFDAEISGDLKLFYSNLELRAGYTF